MCSKEAWVGNVWSKVFDMGYWNPIFSRHFNDWEVEGEKGLYTTQWKEIKSDDFFYQIYVQGVGVMNLYSFPMKSIWSNCVEPKLCFFT